jgi:hypothetical protein
MANRVGPINPDGRGYTRPRAKVTPILAPRHSAQQAFDVGETAGTIARGLVGGVIGGAIGGVPGAVLGATALAWGGQTAQTVTAPNRVVPKKVVPKTPVKKKPVVNRGGR